MPDLDYFYIVRDPDPDDDTWRWLELSGRFADEYGPEAFKDVVDDIFQPDKPVPMKVMRGQRAPDMYGHDCDIHVCSARLTDALEKLSKTGFQKFPVVLYDKSDTKVIDDGLFWIRIDEGAGGFDNTRGAALISMEHWKNDPELTDAYGYYFDTTTWNGADVFRVGRDRIILVTKPIADELMARDFKGLRIESAPEFDREWRDLKVRSLKERFPNGVPEHIRKRRYDV